jgi:hypothetical protein
MTPTRSLEEEARRFLWRHVIFTTAGPAASEISRFPRPGWSCNLEAFPRVRIHEGGHTVAALLCTLPAKWISINNQENKISGYASTAGAETAEDIEAAPSDPVQAGRLLRELKRRGHHGDIDRAISVTKRLLKKHWGRVVSLAHELERQGDCIGEDVILQTTGLPQPSVNWDRAAAEVNRCAR